MDNVFTMIKHHFRVILKSKLSIITLIIPIIPILIGAYLMQNTEEKPIGMVCLASRDQGEGINHLINQLEEERLQVEVIDEAGIEKSIGQSKEGIYILIDTNSLFQSLIEKKQDIHMYQIGSKLESIQVLQVIDNVLKAYSQYAIEAQDEVAFIGILEEQGKKAESLNEVGVKGADEETTKSIFGIFMFLFLLICGKNLDVIIKEKENNVYKRIQAMPVTKGQYLLGHVIGGIGIILIQSVIVYVGMTVVKVDIGLDAGVLLIFCMVLGLIGIAINLVVYQLIKTAEAYYIGATFTMTLLSFMSGALFPIEILPEWMKSMGLLSPITWVVKAYNQFKIEGEKLLSVGYLGVAVLISCMLIMFVLYKQFTEHKIKEVN